MERCFNRSVGWKRREASDERRSLNSFPRHFGLIRPKKDWSIMNSRVGVVLVAFVVGCGGSGTHAPSGSSSGGSCAVTLSGAVTMTLDCVAELDDASAAGGPNVPYVTIGAPSDVFDFSVEPVATMTGTYVTGGIKEYVKGRVVNHATAGTRQEWNIVENDPAEAPNYNNVGTYNLQVTGISSAPSIVKIAGGNLELWNIEGTLDATYGPDASTGAVGDVTVHVAFHDKSMF
jgi:hypothetical protein